MTLDPIHVEGIAELAGQIEGEVDDREHDDFAERVWTSFFDPLMEDGREVLAPIGEQRREHVKCDRIGLSDRPYQTVHGLDGGCLNPTTFVNGAVVDVAHSVLARDPSDHDLHRHRSIVGAIHRSGTVGLLQDGWEAFDDDFGRRRWVQAPTVDRFAEGVVHALALAAAEQQHVSDHLEAVEELLVLDGGLYPKELLRWRDRHEALREVLVSEPLVRELIQLGIDIVDRCLDRDLALVGFVKNPASNRLSRILRRSDIAAPWFTDAGLFRRVLAPPESRSAPTRWLGYTNWFRSRAGTDGTLFELPTLGLSFPRGPDAYEVTFMVIYDPRDDVIYRAEAPAAVTATPDRRERLRTFLLREIAANRGPPTAVRKADQLAKIDRSQKATIRRVLEHTWSTDVDTTYNDLRWGTE